MTAPSPAGTDVPGRKKDLSIQTLRGVACILVVAYHVRGQNPSDGLHLAKTDAWSRIIDSLVYLRMPLFSFLSGFVYAMRPLRSGYPAFVRGKARRLLIPLLVVGTAFAVLQSITPGTNSSVADETPWYLWHIIPIRHLWFLESIFWVFLFVGLLDLFRLLDRLTTVVGIVVAAVVVDTVVPLGNDLVGARLAIYLLPFFLTGVAASRFDWRAAPRPAKFVIVGAVVPLTLVTQLGVWGAIDEIPSRHSPIAGALGICACLALLLTRWTSRVLAYIGGFSFTIYMLHIFGTAGSREVLEKIGITSTTVNMLTGIVGGVVFGILVELVARRSRLGRFVVLGQKYQRRRPAAHAVAAGSAPARASDSSPPATATPDAGTTAGHARPESASAGNVPPPD